MKTRMVLALLVMCFILACSSTSFAQNAELSGRITDPHGLPVPNVKIEAVNVLTNVPTSVETNEVGLYTFASLPPATYRVLVEKEGFDLIVKPGVELHIEDHVVLNFALRVGSMSTSVTVEAGASMINTTDASVSTVVDQTYVKNMPLNGRSLQDLILLTPGTVTQTPQLSQTSVSAGVGQTGEFSVNGQRTESNYYTVDGVSANVGASAGCSGINMTLYAGASGSVAGSTALGTTQALVSVDDLQEFRVETSTYAAEYGRNPGGQIAFETKSGVNRWHGSGYDYLRNDYFDATDFFTKYFLPIDPTLKKGALRQNDFGGTLGGPIEIPKLYSGKDKTFFFVSYEGLRLLQPQGTQPALVPDTALRQSTASPLNQVLNTFPAQTPGLPDDTTNGVAQFIGSWSNPSAIDSTSVRLDQVLGQKLRLFFRFSDTTSDSTLRGGFLGTTFAPSIETVSSGAMRTYTGGVTALLSDRLTNSIHVNYSSNEANSKNQFVSFAGSVPANLAQIAGLGPTSESDILFFLGGGTYFLQVDAGKSIGLQRQWNLVDTLGYSVGKHQLKFGADYRRLTPQAIPTSPFAFWAFSDMNSVQTNTNAFTFISSTGSAYPLYQNFSAFAQDEWKATPRLSLSLGLRWELNPAPGVTQGVMPYTVDFSGGGPDNWTLAPQGTPLWKTTWYNFGPRVGAAYILRATPGWETAVRGGGGVFFDTGQQLGSLSFNGPGFGAANFSTNNSSYPCAAPATCPVSTQVPPMGLQPPYAGVFGYEPHLQLPYTLQWNASVEQALGKSQALSFSYVGSKGRRLLQTNAFTSTSNTILQPGRTFNIVGNQSASDYDALQVQFRRRLSQGLTALAAYTWSHCIDTGSTNFLNGYERENCDFDVRHNFSGAFSYDVPNWGHERVLGAVLHHWGIDDRFLARTAFPVDISGIQSFSVATGNRISNGLNFVSGKPLYIYGAQCDAAYAKDFGSALPCPGGWAINPDAFEAVSSGSGDVPRNFLRGFGAWQMNLAVRREFPITEHMTLQFRAESFNVLNHTNFGTVHSSCGGNPGTPGCTDSQFGQATATLAGSLGVQSPIYQMGGPRSMQFSLRLTF